MLATLERMPEGDPGAEDVRRQLVEMHAPVARHIARRYRNRGEPLEDLQQAALVGLMKAINGFDPQFGKDFMAYALPMMTGEVKRHFRDRTWAVRVPRKHQEKRAELNRTVAEFTQKEGRSPTVKEIAVALEMTEEETIELLDASAAYSALSLDVPYGAEDEDTTLGETLGEADAAIERVVDHEALMVALEDIPVRERRILLLRFFGNMTQAEIADRVGLSQMHVSRLLAQTLQTLRVKLTEER
nr:SigB/SigF/SigG family RNA polymerase sigma factor [Allonocardiopsis opalescens]